jgi:subtilase family serine protease
VIVKGTEVTVDLTTVDLTPRVQSDTVPGSYIVRACVDSLKTVDEISESNNCGDAPGTLTVTGLPLSPSDLKVTKLTLPPPPLEFLPGQGFQLTAKVENHGPVGNKSIPTTTRFYFVDAADVRTGLKGVQFLDGVTVGAPSEKTTNVQVAEGTAAGTYHVVACADGKKEINEVNEDDNCLPSAGTVTVLPAPDLVATFVDNPPANILPGGSFDLANTTVENTGPQKALASIVKFFLATSKDPAVPGVRIDMIGTLDVPELAVSAAPFVDPATTKVKVRLETLPDTYYVQACADGGKDILEGNEDDNCVFSSKTVTVGKVADLVIGQVRLPTSPTPLTVAPGGTVSLTAVVKNQGTADAGSSSLKFSLVLTPAAAPIKKLPEVVAVPGPVVAKDEKTVTATVTVPNNTPLGKYFVQACADVTNAVVESSDSNNCGTSTDTLQVK